MVSSGSKEVCAKRVPPRGVFAGPWERCKLLTMRLEAFCALAALLGCAPTPGHYAASGDCITDGSGPSCGVGSAGGGGGTPPADAGTGEDSGSSPTSEGGSCGSVGLLFPTQNAGCENCFETDCCVVNQACTSTSGCEALIQCAFTNCPTGTTTPSSSCAYGCTGGSAAINAYIDVGGCIANSVANSNTGSTSSPCVACPALPSLGP